MNVIYNLIISTLLSEFHDWLVEISSLSSKVYASVHVVHACIGQRVGVATVADCIACRCWYDWKGHRSVTAML